MRAKEEKEMMPRRMRKKVVASRLWRVEECWVGLGGWHKIYELLGVVFCCSKR